MKAIQIEILNTVECRACEEGRKFLKPHMFITKEFWKKGKYGRKEKRTYPYYLIDRTGHFLTGFIPRVKKICEDNDITISWSGKISYPGWLSPFLPGIDFRPDQLTLIDSALEKKRGVLKAPTGSGKTILALGIVSCFFHRSLEAPSNPRVLYLAHTVSICGQVAKEFEKYGYDVGKVYGGKIELNKKITVATRQSLAKQDISLIEEVWKPWDIVLLDEVHHLSSFSGQYADIFTNLQSPIRIGMTATLPTAEEAKMAIEGFIGPVIGQLDINEAHELGILAKPKIKLVRVPHKSTELRKYAEIYQAGIVDNRNRNRLILEMVKERIDAGETVLILVTRIEHGENLHRMAELFGLDVKYLHGASEAEEREMIRKELIEKKTKCVISTVIWREGINIPSLNCVVNAAGGKSEIATLQAIGRGLRKTDDKEEVLIVDFLDTSRYLAEHAIARISTYVENSWL